MEVMSKYQFQELLDDRSHHIEFHGHLTNHVKHAMVALRGLHASDEWMKKYYHHYASKTPYGFPLEPARSSSIKITDSNWKTYLGKRALFSAYCEFFDEKERQLGTDALLEEYVPILMQGWVGSLTHGTIHLGWALDAGHRWMMIEGLAYMAFSFLPFDQEKFSHESSHQTAKQWSASSPLETLMDLGGLWEDPTLGLKEWVESLMQEPTPSRYPDLHPELIRSGLQFRIARLIQTGHPLIHEYRPWMDFEEMNLMWERLYEGVALLYLASSGNFVILHLLSALHAIEQIAQRLPSDHLKFMIRSCWVGMLSILLASGQLPSAVELREAWERSGLRSDGDQIEVAQAMWSSVIAQAVLEEEEHNPKMVYVLKRCWERFSHRALFREAARHFTKTPELPPSFMSSLTEVSA